MSGPGTTPPDDSMIASSDHGCTCGPEASARLIGDEAFCNVCDKQVQPKAKSSLFLASFGGRRG